MSQYRDGGDDEEEIADAASQYGDFDTRSGIEVQGNEEDDYVEDRGSGDTSSTEARRGKDIQGIPWDSLNITREKYRQSRLEQYRNYENIPGSGKNAERVSNQTHKGHQYYWFMRNTRSVKSSVLHFQLRHLIWSTSKHDVYLVSQDSVLHWSSLTSKKTEIFDFRGHIAPCEKHQGNLSEGFQHMQISTLAVKKNLLVAGGFQGELICKYIDRPGISFCTRVTYDDNSITNAVEIYDSPTGSLRFMASSNDCGVRDFDAEKFQLSSHFRFLWPVNHTSLSPDGKLIVVVGDSTDGVLVDSQNGRSIQELKGHFDYSFSSAWHPDGRIFATGNQDKTCRVWDIRNLSRSVAVLRGDLGAIRSIRFTSDGQYMAMAEAADFVHIFDVNSGYEKQQEVDIFGEISGISFSPDTETLFISVWDRTYGSLLQFNRCHNYSYLSTIF